MPIGDRLANRTVTLLRRSTDTLTDRCALGLRWHSLAWRSLTAAGYVVTMSESVVDGPQVCQFEAALSEHVTRSEASDLEARLTHALDVRNGSVLVIPRGAVITITVPWPTRNMIPAAKMMSHGPRIQIGTRPNGGPLVLSFDEPGCTHVLIAGQTGSGKSHLLRTIALLLARGNAPEMLALVMLDKAFGHPDGAFTPFPSLSHLARPVADGIDASRAALEWVVRTHIEQPAAPCVVLVDEAPDLGEDERTRAALVTIAREGRKHGVHLVLAAQDATADSIARPVKTQFGISIVGRMRDHYASRAAGVHGAEHLLGAGDMLASFPGSSPVRFQAALTSQADVDALPTRQLTTGEATQATDSRVAWAVANPRGRQATGFRVASVKAIREQFGVGTTEARLIRDAAEVQATYSNGDVSVGAQMPAHTPGVA